VFKKASSEKSGFRRKYRFLRQGDYKEMAKSISKKTKGTVSAKKVKKSKKAAKGQTRTTEYMDCLLELHKLQGVLLKQLAKEI
jgi:hypothetical protein